MFIKKLVSGERKRYVSDEHNIDLSYICSDRIIVMSFPASGLASNWRNNIKDVSTIQIFFTSLIAFATVSINIIIILF